MKILHVNTNDICGGAARAAYRLHTGLGQIGIHSRMLVRNKQGNDPTVSIFHPTMRPIGRLQRVIKRKMIAQRMARYSSVRPAGLELFTDDRCQYGKDLIDHIPDDVIVNLHWISDMVDYRAFFERAHRMPIVWTLHDMNAFTGGCHYDLGCARYNVGCGQCPQLGSMSKKDLSHEVWKRKESMFKSLQPWMLNIVALNEWMANEVKNSELLNKFPVTIIPNGINHDLYVARDQETCRDLFGIDRNASVFLFVSDSLSIKRKGYLRLREALGKISDTRNGVLLTVGAEPLDIDMNMKIVHVGRIENERILSFVYSAADLVLLPSIQDNLPNVILESLACGTPVLAYSVGGIPSAIMHNKTGFLIADGNVAAFADVINDVLMNRGSVSHMRTACRNVAVSNYTLEVQARRYAALYSRLVHTPGGKTGFGQA